MSEGVLSILLGQTPVLKSFSTRAIRKVLDEAAALKMKASLRIADRGYKHITKSKGASIFIKQASDTRVEMKLSIDNGRTEIPFNESELRGILSQRGENYEMP